MSYLRADPDTGELLLEPDAIAAARALQAGYRSAEPFPHLILDDFLEAGLAERLAASFPPPHLATVQRANRFQNGKRGYRPAALGDHPAAQLLQAFSGSSVVALVEALTGREALAPDPEFVGGGLHEIERGGHLSVHADFLLHPGLKLARRVNLILFLSPHWEAEWGGALELWDRAMTRPVVSVLPRFNRAVLFDTSRSSYHGHPDPLACPAGVQRRSMALYFYGAPRWGERLESRTFWRVRPGSGDAPPERARFVRHFEAARRRIGSLFPRLGGGRGRQNKGSPNGS